MAEQSKIINVNVGEEGAAKLDRIAERFKVSRVKALIWVLDSIDADVFLPYGFPNTTIVSDKQNEQVPA
jgi:hypothetical protein